MGRLTRSTSLYTDVIALNSNAGYASIKKAVKKNERRSEDVLGEPLTGQIRDLTQHKLKATSLTPQELCMRTVLNICAGALNALECRPRSSSKSSSQKNCDKLDALCQDGPMRVHVLRSAHPDDRGGGVVVPGLVI